MQWLPLGWVDVAMLAVVIVSAAAGLLRGITAELLSLAGWFVAYFGARWFAPWVATWLPIGGAGSALNLGAAFALTFVGVLVIWSFVVRAASALIAATPLRPLDRLLGALFGLVRGLLVLLVVATVIAYTPLAQAPAWRQSAGAALLGSVLQELLPMLRTAPARRAA